MNVNYLVFFSVLALSISLPSAFADNIFLKIDTISGESTDSAHKDWIEVTSWSWGDSRTGTTSGERDASRVSIEDLTITKQLDKSSPLIFLAAANGQIFSEVVFETISPTSTEAYLIYTLEDVIFTGYEISAGGDSFPTETISLSFSQIKVTHSESDVETYWDLTTNDGGTTSSTSTTDTTTTDTTTTDTTTTDTIIDTDFDGLSDVDEMTYGTDPLNPDTDFDGMLDGDEIMMGTDPLMPDGPGGQAFTFGGTLESDQTFAIMESDGTTSTYGKQGYAFGNKSAGTGLPVTNSDKICGLSLCTEKMSTAEIIQQYLQSKGLD